MGASWTCKTARFERALHGHARQRACSASLGFRSRAGGRLRFERLVAAPAAAEGEGRLTARAQAGKRRRGSWRPWRAPLASQLSQPSSSNSRRRRSGGCR
eukprot:CAMPEP_0119378084 /NCGR_PEP_ID=MMETSP1334-20130426/47391_1 /TAXON_ID=127549 /ORGANISM="Calcidiscus leptoporus, Strain RCC1130" /LENGTH=99 /DNA_ID=CAMNT_0007397189 /DNA_START=644 /DNA_END=943 /DNA_ORIENTATION=+